MRLHSLFLNVVVPRTWLKIGFHIRGKRKRLAAAECGMRMRYVVYMWYANDLIPYTFTHAFALSFTERRRDKNMA